MTDLAAMLTAHVESAHEDPVVWGVSDCTMYCAQWFEMITGKRLDLAPYASRDEALALIANSGGLVSLWSEALGKAGFYPHHGDPEFGDVGIVDMGRWGHVGMIFAHGGIGAWRADPGVKWCSPRQKHILKVWSIIR